MSGSKPYDSDEVYRFIADAKDLKSAEAVMLWNVAGPLRVTLAAQQPMRAVDMLGESRELTPVDGQLAIDIGPCPVNIVP